MVWENDIGYVLCKKKYGKKVSNCKKFDYFAMFSRVKLRIGYTIKDNYYESEIKLFVNLWLFNIRSFYKKWNLKFFFTHEFSYDLRQVILFEKQKKNGRKWNFVPESCILIFTLIFTLYKCKIKKQMMRKI